MEQHIRSKLNSRWKWWWNTETPPSNRTKCLSFIFDDTHFAFRIWLCSTLTTHHSIYSMLLLLLPFYLNICNKLLFFVSENIFRCQWYTFSSHIWWARSQRMTWNNTNFGIHWSSSFLFLFSSKFVLWFGVWIFGKCFTLICILYSI